MSAAMVSRKYFIFLDVDSRQQVELWEVCMVCVCVCVCVCACRNIKTTVRVVSCPDYFSHVEVWAQDHC